MNKPESEMVLVPRVPTQAMCQAGQDKAREWPRFPLRISPIYQAMLAAAPTRDATDDAELDRLWEQVKLAAPSSLHRCYARTVLAAHPSNQVQEPVAWRPMESAPTDGTIVRLLVDYRGDGCHPLEDAEIAQTIGGNTDGNTSDKEGWKFAGWSWEQDCFTEGKGKPIGWLPLDASPAAFPQAVPSEQPIAEQPQAVNSNLTSASGGGDLPPALPKDTRPAFEQDMRIYGWRDFNGRWVDDCWYYDLEGLQARWFGWKRRATCEASAGAVPSDKKYLPAASLPVSAPAGQEDALTLSDELIDATLGLAYDSSGLNGMTGQQWDRIVARRFFSLGAAIALGIIPPATTKEN